MSNTTLGSACLSEDKGADKGLVYNGQNIGFGESIYNEGRGLYHGQRITKHFLTVAPTRSGKGACLIIPNLLTYKGSAIVIDPKGENAYITAKQRRTMGQKTYVLDPWGETNRRYGSKTGQKEEIAKFNPLSILDPQDPNYSDDLSYIADALIINEGKDPHWDNSARELVAGICSYVVEKYGKAASLRMVRHILAQPPEYIADIAKEAQDFPIDSLGKKKLARFMSDNREILGIISTALTQTAFLDNEALLKNLDESSFSFESLTGWPAATIYLVLPVDKLRTHGRWLRLMVSIGIRALSRNTAKIPLPVLFVLDEFGTIGKLSAVSQAYGLMAGLQMCILAFVQDLVQLKRDYGEEWETFVANSQAVIFFNIMDHFTAEYLSKAIGTKTIERISQASAEEKKKNPNYSAMSDQYIARQLITPDEIRGSSWGFAIRTGTNELLGFQKKYYYEDPFFYRLARIDPYYPDCPAAKEEKSKKEREEQENIGKRKRFEEVGADIKGLANMRQKLEKDFPDWRRDGKANQKFSAIIEEVLNIFKKQKFRINLTELAEIEVLIKEAENIMKKERLICSGKGIFTKALNFFS